MALLPFILFEVTKRMHMMEASWLIIACTGPWSRQQGVPTHTKEMWVYTTTDTKKRKFCGGLQAKLGLQSSQPAHLHYEEHQNKFRQFCHFS